VFGKELPIMRPALGLFKHEAAAVDPVNHHVYLTEDESDGRLYRFVPERLTPGGYTDLSRGRLEVATWLPDGNVTWTAVPDPSGFLLPTRLQIASSTAFRGGEGIWCHGGVIYFATKGDNRVWAYTIATGVLRVLYDRATSSTPTLSGVDNVFVSPMGDVLVAEDGADLEIVLVLPDNTVKPIVQLTGQTETELTGPALSPSGNRLYFSSQRAPSGSLLASGVTYEVTGPFLS
jgi:secreted PhoX family phosphatase